MQKIILIIGLPGSGKTMYLAKHKNSFGNAFICDDYHKSAGSTTVDGFRTLEKSAYYEDLQKALQEGKNVVISDITYCKEDCLREIEEDISHLLSESSIQAEIERRYFENDPNACIANIFRRARNGRVEWELQFVKKTTLQYKVPTNAQVIPVYKP